MIIPTWVLVFWRNKCFYIYILPIIYITFSKKGFIKFGYFYNWWFLHLSFTFFKKHKMDTKIFTDKCQRSWPHIIILRKGLIMIPILILQSTFFIYLHHIGVIFKGWIWVSHKIFQDGLSNSKVLNLVQFKFNKNKES